MTNKLTKSFSKKLRSISILKKNMGNSSSSESGPFPPTWDELSSSLKSISPDPEKPVLTFYRDSNGWCPFCERVWIALEIKGIPYKEQLIKLAERPDWFLEVVPSGKVPALLIYNDETDERSLIWESETILKKLDELFPDTPKLMLTDLPKFQEGVDLVNKVKDAGSAYAGFPPSTSIKKDVFEKKKKDFESALDEFDAFIKSNGGPFILGSEVTFVDLLITSWVERWAYQLPVTVGMDIFKDRPNLQMWIREGMGKLPGYVNRVAGDKYSWTGVLHFLLTTFGEKNKAGADEPQIVEAKEKVNSTALALTADFAKEKKDWAIQDGCSLTLEEVARRAAAKIVSNYTLIVEDCTYDKKPNTQTHITRANSQKNADVALRAVVDTLLNGKPSGDVKIPSFDSKEDASDAAQAMKTISNRLCVPRDMGAPSAAVLRKVLTKVADGIVAAH